MLDNSTLLIESEEFRHHWIHFGDSFEDMQTFVYTSEEFEDNENIDIVDDDISEAMNELQTLMRTTFINTYFKP